MEKVKQSRKGCKTYTYWMACWREGDKTRNVHLGSAGKTDTEAARQKARELKEELLGDTLNAISFSDHGLMSVRYGC